MRPEKREKLEAAQAKARAVAEAEAKAAGGATFDRLNPMTGEIASRAAASGVEDAKRAVDAAAAAMPDHPVMAASSDAARIMRARTRVDSHPGAAAPVRSSARPMRPPCLVVIAAPRT